MRLLRAPSNPLCSETADATIFSASSIGKLASTLEYFGARRPSLRIHGDPRLDLFKIQTARAHASRDRAQLAGDDQHEESELIVIRTDGEDALVLFVLCMVAVALEIQRTGAIGEVGDASIKGTS